jgi:hypothetical protein
MDIQLQWTGIGVPSKAREHIMLDYPGFRVNSGESGTTRAADVTGVVSDGTTNYVSGAWAGGTLNSVAAGQVDHLPLKRRYRSTGRGPFSRRGPPPRRVRLAESWNRPNRASTWAGRGAPPRPSAPTWRRAAFGGMEECPPTR